MQICTLSVLELTLTLFFLDEVLVSYLNTVILSDIYSQFCSFCILDLEYIPPQSAPSSQTLQGAIQDLPYRSLEQLFSTNSQVLWCYIYYRSLYI